MNKKVAMYHEVDESITQHAADQSSNIFDKNLSHKYSRTQTTQHLLSL